MWLKICGITDEDDGRLAASLGADAVGFVFWPGSRRFVAPVRAASIAAALPAGIERVGVFVNQDPDVIEAIASEVGLDVIQLHGNREPQDSDHSLQAVCGAVAHRFEREKAERIGLATADRFERAKERPRLIAALSVGPDFDVAAVDAVPRGVTVLLDAADRGAPGGTGRMIDWDKAALVACRRPTILAGGLTPENVAQAIQTVRPCGVDVASGVEFPACPGVKDPDRLTRFVAAVRRAEAMVR